jgi:hypothetical protein
MLAEIIMLLHAMNEEEQRWREQEMRYGAS